jgi:hypothetical protein
MNNMESFEYNRVILKKNDGSEKGNKILIGGFPE